jgi:dihydroorotate dehydrogenase
MDMYKRLIRPLLFGLDPETAHEVAKAVLRHAHLSRLLVRQNLAIHDNRLQVDLGRLRLPNPVGLGAGFDKDCEMVDSLERLGFGYIVVGSVMCRVRPGNPKPRMIRDLDGEGLFSCMGLPSKGLDYATRRLKRRSQGALPIIINFNAETFAEYLRCTEVLEPLGDAIEISLFLANRAADEGDFLDPARARTLLEEVARRTKKPVFIKLPGYDSEDERRRRLDLINLLISYDVDGITITPKTSVKDKRLSIEQGAVTGRPAFKKTLDIIQDVFEATKGKCPIKAAGGIFSAKDAFDAIAVGATTVEMVTGFGYEGWRIAWNINQGLLRLLDESGIENVSALRGAKTSIHRRLNSSSPAHPAQWSARG